LLLKELIIICFYIIIFNNNQSILEGLIRAMPQLTERNQLMKFIISIFTYNVETLLV